jgi:gephyrin
MAEHKLKAAILVVSDTASQDPSTDRVADTLTTLFSAEGSTTWDQPTTKIVADNVLDIQRSVCDWSDGPNWVNLILLSGGTGFAVKDNTPEVR